MKDKTTNLISEAITFILFLLVIILMIVAVGSFIYNIIESENKRLRGECEKKTVIEIENIPMSNFWGKEIKHIIKFNDGSQRESSLNYKIGEEVCK